MKKVLNSLFGEGVTITRVEKIALHVLIFHAVGGIELLKGWF